MTLAVNLANLPNYVSNSGQFNAATGLVNQVPVANGGTGQSSLTSGYYLKGNGTGPVVVQNGIPASDIIGTIAVAWAGITGKPTTIAGYGITDAITTATIGAQSVNLANAAASVTWGNVGGKPTFATVATTGLYSDLSGKPTFATVATSGSYNDLLNKPSIPTSILNLGITDGTNGQVLTTNGAGVFTFTTQTGGSGSYSNSNVSSYLGAGGLTIGTSTIIAPVINASATATNMAVQINSTFASSNVLTNYGNTILYKNLLSYANLQTQGGYFVGDGSQLTNLAWASISGKPTFATVATSGSYTDLTNKPTIPTVPTVVSAFTNDAQYAVLPSQSLNAGKFLTTNGATTSWAAITQGGVTALYTSGAGLTVNGSTGAVTISTTAITQIMGGTGISASLSGQTATITNTGVTSMAAGTGLSVSGAIGAVTVSVNSTSNGYGIRTVSSSSPTGGSVGDIWYQI